MTAATTPRASATLSARFEASRHWLTRRARGWTNDPDVADDLVQETVLKAVRHGRLGDDDLDRRWMARVLRNAFLMRARAEQRRAAREATAAGDDVRVADPADALARAERFATLHGALARVREPFHSTLRMRYFEQAEPSAIARQLGVPASTVRRRHQLAIAALRRELVA